MLDSQENKRSNSGALRAQIIVEFLVIIAAALFIGVLYLATANNLFTGIGDQQRVIALNDIGYNIQDEIILSMMVDDGYQRTFTLPNLAGPFPYTIQNDQTTVTLTSGSVTITYDLPQITGSFHIGKNTVTKNGSVVVTPT